MFRQAFTLVEFLIVLSIIVVLSLLITGASISTPINRKAVNITSEIVLLHSAIEEFKSDFGAYPPNAVDNSRQNNLEQTNADPHQDVLAFFQRAFPRNQEPDGLLRALAGYRDQTATLSHLPYGITAHESLFFWLGGFSLDPLYPLSGPGGPSFTDSEGNRDGILDARDEQFSSRNLRYEFDFQWIGPRTGKRHFDDRGLLENGGRFVTYNDPRNGELRRINLWQYFPGSSEISLAYFDTSRHTPAKYYPEKVSFIKDHAAPLLRIQNGVESIRGHEKFQFVNQGSFQILHAGLDGKWGNTQAFRSGELLFPTGPFQGALADTVTNFAPGQIEHAKK